MKRFLPLVLAAALTPAMAADLTIYTYDSFNSEWGPGPKLKEAFEADCQCEIEFVGVEDGVSILNRLRIEGENAKADVIMGIDDALMEETRETGLIAPSGVETSELDEALKWSDTDFVPFDFGYFAFIYNSEKITKPVSSLMALAESNAKVLYQDPRTSTPGLGLVHWVQVTQGDKAADFWKALSDNTVTVTKGWWEAYEMFLNGGSDYVLSYTTSPAYHAIVDSTKKYKAIAFDEGHVAQIELAAQLKSSDNPKLAKQFLNFLISDKAQAIIPVTNWMLPVREVKLPDVFSTLVEPKRIGFDAKTIASQRKAWIDTWRNNSGK